MTSKQRNRPSTPTSKARKLPLGLILGGVFTVLLIVTVFLTLGDGSSTNANASTSGLPDEYGSPTVNGALPVLVDTLTDPTIGTAAPEVIGSDFTGSEVSITNDGRSKVILFLAHWCPHCQNEVPWVTDWLEETGPPDGMDFYGVATSIDRTQDNWPPSEWLEREGFAAPVIVDDRINSIGDAYGLSAYPYWVFVNADGTIATRIAGGISSADLDEILATVTQP